MAIKPSKMLIDVFDQATHKHTVTGTCVCMDVERDFGMLAIRVDKDTLTITARDGDGEDLKEVTFNLDELMKPDDLDEELKTLDTVAGEIKEAGIGEQPNPLTQHGETQG